MATGSSLHEFEAETSFFLLWILLDDDDDVDVQLPVSQS
jgi:hypothetical protein